MVLDTLIIVISAIILIASVCTLIAVLIIVCVFAPYEDKRDTYDNPDEIKEQLSSPTYID